jgi:hypothetical protein
MKRCGGLAAARKELKCGVCSSSGCGGVVGGVSRAGMLDELRLEGDEDVLGRAWVESYDRSRRARGAYG